MAAVPGRSAQALGDRMNEISPSQPVAVPRQVTLALYLLGAAFVFSILRLVFTPHWSHPGSHVFPIFLVAAVYFFWLYGLVRRLNWLRWVTVVLSGIGLITMPWWLPKVDDHTQLAFHLLQCAAQIPGTLLLCLPAAQAWYGRRAVA